CDSVVTFYNKTLLQNAGIDTRDIVNGWTWDTFLNKLDAYRNYLDNNGKTTYYCIDMNLYEWLSVNYPILASYGGSIIDKNLNVTVDSPETREALRMVRTMVEKRYIPYPGKDCSNSFEAGSSPFLFQSSSISHYADRAQLKGKIDITSFPLITAKSNPKIGCGIAAYAINAKTSHKVACWQFLNTLISKDGQQAMATGNLHLPSIRKDLQDPATANWMKGYEDLNLAAYTYGPEYKTTPEFLAWPDPRAKSELDQALKDLFYNATRDDKDDAIEYAIRVCKDTVADAIDY
ncbi:MAG: extracellular solute-binding protein, partial [Bacilli bacterium]|nr:extracellular solute-binding protein [Bacilli bacterium]